MPRTDVDRTISRIAAVTLAASIIVLPVNSQLTLFLDDRGVSAIEPLVSWVRVSPLDAVFVALIVIAVIWEYRFGAGWRGLGLVDKGMVVACVIATVSAITHLDMSSVSMTLRLVGVAAGVYLMSRIRESDLRVRAVTALLAIAAFEATIALIQVFTDSGDIVEATVYASGRSWTAGHGTFQGPYTMAAFLTVSIAVGLGYRHHLGDRSRYAAIAVAVSSAGMATTFGRTATMSLLAVVAVYGIAAVATRRRAHALDVALIVVPFLTVAVILWSGWAVRIHDTATIEDRGRTEQYAVALDLIREHPVLGVGPGRYVESVDENQRYVVHDVPLLIGAELGVIAAIGFVLWMAAIGFRALRASWHAAALFLPLMPYLLFDKLHVVFVAGLALSVVWLGFISRTLTRDTERLA